MSDFWDNLKHALRMFRTNPGFTGFAIAALALGIGINSAIFTVVDTVLLKPLTYPDADRIVQFMHVSPEGKSNGTSIPDFLAWEGQGSGFQDVAGYDFGEDGFPVSKWLGRVLLGTDSELGDVLRVDLERLPPLYKLLS